MVMMNTSTKILKSLTINTQYYSDCFYSYYFK